MYEYRFRQSKHGNEQMYLIFMLAIWGTCNFEWLSFALDVLYMYAVMVSFLNYISSFIITTIIDVSLFKVRYITSFYISSPFY